MRARALLRGVVAFGGVGFAVFLYLRYERTPVVPVAPAKPAIADGATFQSVMSDGGKQIRYKGEKEVGAISYAKLTRFPDGRQEVEQPRFEGDRDGRPYVITADHGVLQSPPGVADPNQVPEETHLTGHVELVEEDGMRINSDAATFRESAGLLDMPGAVTFSDGKVSGRGVGALYDRTTQVLTLRDQAEITIAPGDDGRGGLTGTSRTMLLNRVSHFAQLDTDATIVRETETLKAVNTQMHLTPDNQGVELMEMRGNASVVPTGAGSKTPEMRADDMNLEFQPDGRTLKRTQLMRRASLVLATASGRQVITGDTLDVRLAGNGQTVTGLNGNGVPVAVQLPATQDTPERRVTGRSLSANGTERDGLTSATFTQNVEFAETRGGGRGAAPSTRTVSARQLTLALDAGGLGDIKDAVFQDGVAFRDGETTGKADRATYQAKAGQMALRVTAADRRAEVRTGRMRVEAREIDVNLEKTSLAARGAVRTDSTPERGARASSKGLFDAGAATFGTAEELEYDDEAGTATYRKGAQLVQGTGADLHKIQAALIAVDDQAGNLTAEGSVVTILPIQGTANAKGEAPRATADRFTFVDSTRRATYTGTPKALVELPGPDGTLKAVTVEITLDRETRDLRRLVADGPPGQSLVAARIASDQTARGDHLDYDAVRGSYVLVGQPGRIIERRVDKNGDACQETFAERMSYTKASGATGVDFQGKGRSGTTTNNLSNCTTWVIK